MREKSSRTTLPLLLTLALTNCMAEQRCSPWLKGKNHGREKAGIISPWTDMSGAAGAAATL
jgi:hypothetical protein